MFIIFNVSRLRNRKIVPIFFFYKLIINNQTHTHPLFSKMNTLALIAFALWALFMRCLPKIMEFIKLRQWSASIPGPSISELIENVKKGRKLRKRRKQFV